MMSKGEVALALTVCVIITSGAAMATSAPVVKGDPQAWAEIETALLKLTRVRSYRVKGVVSVWVNLGGAVEVVNPDRTHAVLVSNGSIGEGIQVGNDGRSRGSISLDGSSGDFFWRCEKSTSGLPPPIDFLTLLGMSPPFMSEVTAARGSVAIVDGIPTRSYSYTYAASAENPSWEWLGLHKLFVAVATGLPTRIQWVRSNEEIAMQAEFYDYDAPISIELPSCMRSI